MKNLKKVFISIFAIMILLQMPVIVSASNEDIVKKYNEYLLNNNNILSSEITINPIEIEPRWSVQQKTITRTAIKDAKILCYITRTSTDSPINLTLTVEGDYNIDAAIFNASTDKIMGNTKHLAPNQLNSVNWTAEELGTEQSVYVFLANYRQVTEYVSGAVTY